MFSHTILIIIKLYNHLCVIKKSCFCNKKKDVILGTPEKIVNFVLLLSFFLSVPKKLRYKNRNIFLKLLKCEIHVLSTLFLLLTHKINFSAQISILKLTTVGQCNFNSSPTSAAIHYHNM